MEEWLSSHGCSSDVLEKIVQLSESAYRDKLRQCWDEELGKFSRDLGKEKLADQDEQDALLETLVNCVNEDTKWSELQSSQEKCRDEVCRSVSTGPLSSAEESNVVPHFEPELHL